MKKISLLSFLVGLLCAAMGQQRQPVSQLSNATAATHAYTHCTLVPAPGLKWEDATLIVREGIIEAAGKDLPIPPHAVVHDMQGRWIYPGFIDAASDLGLKPVTPRSRSFGAEPNFERTQAGPYYWNEAIRPEFRLAESYQQDTKKAATLRKAGFTTVNVVPNDGIFRGEGLLLNLGEGSLQEEMISVRSCAGVSLSKGSSKQDYPSSLMGAMALLRQALLDADHYRQAQAAFAQNPRQTSPEPDLSLEALNRQRSEALPFIFQTASYLHTLRAAKIGREMGIQWVYHSKGDEYLRIDEMKALDADFIVPIYFPAAYDLAQPGATQAVTLEQLKHWEHAPANPALLAKHQIPFAFTLSGADSLKLLPALRKACLHGLSETDALAALTTVPARILKAENRLGSLEKGKIANFIVVSDDLFAPDAKILETYTSGQQHKIEALPEQDPLGTYTLEIDGKTASLSLTKNPAKPTASLRVEEQEGEYTGTATIKGLEVSIPLRKGEALIRLWALMENESLRGTGINAQGKRFSFLATQSAAAAAADSATVVKLATATQLSAITFPNGAFGFESLPEALPYLIRNATVWTNTDKGILTGADVLVQDGKITQVGANIRISKEVEIIDGTGLHLTPGIIDEHSHIAVQEGVNEGTHTVTAEVRVQDVVNPDDIQIYRQLAGGVTTSQLLHGSANPIGGQSALIKLRWGATAAEMLYEGAPGSIKFALGENVKRSRYGRTSPRYPNTRMGVEQIMQDVFRQAKDYRREWQDWEQKGKAQSLIPPRRDLQLETLLEILDDRRRITCHSYVQSEIVMLLRLAEREGFRVNTLTHILEGYKVADKIKAHGASVSTFSDWWAYKYEVIDAIPHNAALMYEQGLNVCINSDDAEMARRLNQEAAKAVKYGGVPEIEALKMVTLNPAKALGIDERVGSIAPGKDADIVLWSDHPLSVYAVAQKTFVDGKLYFDLARDRELRITTEASRNRIVQKMLVEPGKKTSAPAAKTGGGTHHCLDESDF